MVELARHHSFGTWLVAAFVLFGLMAAFWR
jgi:hypothetical protein